MIMSDEQPYSKDNFRMETPLGAEVVLYEASHLGDGLMFHVRVKDDRAFGHAEVFLSDENLMQIENYLAFRRESRTGLDIIKPPMCSSHREVQHRDRLPPWCNSCGWAWSKPAVEAKKYGNVT